MMKAFLRAFRRTALATLATLAAAGASAGEGATYQFSPVNQYGISLTAAYWNPILSYVSARSGVNLALKIGRTSADTTAYVLANEVEFVFSNHLFSPEREKLGWRAATRRRCAGRSWCRPTPPSPSCRNWPTRTWGSRGPRPPSHTSSPMPSC